MTTNGPGDRTCRLTLTITIDGKNTEYTVRPIHSDYHVRAWQVNKGDGMVYAVTQELSGKRSCDCGDSVFRDQSCKHIKSCAALGLFLSPRELLALQREARVGGKDGR
jgi:hypothetical protein